MKHYTIEQVFGPAPVSESYHGQPHGKDWQAARNEWDRLAAGFVGVKARIDSDGEILAPMGELNAKQLAQIEPARRVAVKLETVVHVVLWDLGHGKLHAVTKDVTAPGSSVQNNVLREVRPLRLPLDFFGKPGLGDDEVDKMIVGELIERIDKGIPILLADDGLLPPSKRQENNRLLREQADAEDLPGVEALPSL